MHLTSKQLLLLFLPLSFTLVVYYFSDNIVKNVKYLFPNYKEYFNKNLNEKATIYLQIEAKDKTYQTIQENLAKRPINSDWIANKILYTEYIDTTPTEKRQSTSVAKRKTTRVRRWHLEAIFSQDNVAIINGHIVKLNTIINGSKLQKIETDKVLLENKKGKKWIYLFR